MVIGKTLYSTENLASDKEKIAKEIFYDNIMPLARESFEHDGELGPMIFIFLDDGSPDKVGIAPMPAAMFMENPDKKDLLANLLREFTNVVEIVGIGMFSEAWITVIDRNTKEEKKSEGVFYSFESENIISIVRDMIIRKEGIKLPTLQKGTIESDGTMKGRFAGFLKDMRKQKHN